MEYKGYRIEEVTALTGQQDNDGYTITGSRPVYQISCPANGYIYAVTATLERAKKIVDKQGKRWQAQQNQEIIAQ